MYHFLLGLPCADGLIASQFAELQRYFPERRMRAHLHLEELPDAQGFTDHVLGDPETRRTLSSEHPTSQQSTCLPHPGRRTALQGRRLHLPASTRKTQSSKEMVFGFGTGIENYHHFRRNPVHTRHTLHSCRDR